MKKIDPFYAIQAGWVRYKNNAGMYTAFTIIYLVACLMIALIGSGMGQMFGLFGDRVASLISVIAVGVGTTFLTMGYAHVARKDERGELIEFGDFFTAFQINQKSLIGVVIITALVSQVGTFLMPDEILYLGSEGEYTTIEDFQMLFEDMGQLYAQNAGILVFIFLIQLVFGVGFMFSTYRASIAGADVLESLKWSFPRAWRNFFRIVFLGLITSIMVAILTIVTFLVGLIVIIPWLMLVQFEMYDQVDDKTEELDTISEGFKYEN